MDLMNLTSEDVTLNFKGLLANVDASIMKVKFNNEFRIEAFSEEEALNLLSTLDEIPKMELAHKYFTRYNTLNYSEHKMYMISRKGEYEPKDFFLDTARFDNKWVLDYLQPRIRLMRLFKEGNICMPLTFYYSQKNDIITRSFHHICRLINNQCIYQ